MYSHTNQDIEYLGHILVVTHVRSNHANFQRFWPIDKGAESFEKREATVHSNFTVESKTHYRTRSAKARKIRNPRFSAFNICHLSKFPVHIHRNGKFSGGVSMLLIN